MVNALGDLDVWSPIGEVDQDYSSFYALNHEMLDLLTRQAQRKLPLWDVEHAMLKCISLKNLRKIGKSFMLSG